METETIEGMIKPPNFIHIDWSDVDKSYIITSSRFIGHLINEFMKIDGVYVCIEHEYFTQLLIQKKSKHIEREVTNIFKSIDKPIPD